MITNFTPLNEERAQMIEQRGMLMGKDQHGFPRIGIDVVYPFFILSLCTQGSARARYDMQEVTHSKNELAFVLPGHLLHPISNTEDFTFTWLIVSPEVLLKNGLLSPSISPKSSMELFEKAPICRLTDEQAHRLLTFIDQLEYVNSFTEEQLPHRNQIMINLMMAGHELLLYFRKDQDQEWLRSRQTILYQQFVNLVVTHYKEERNVNYYARRLDYEPRYFSKLFRAASNGISPLEWISQYVATQAKLIINANPNRPIKEVAYKLGFPNTANFCRYFRRATSITPQEYKLMYKSQAGGQEQIV